MEKKKDIRMNKKPDIKENIFYFGLYRDLILSKSESNLKLVESKCFQSKQEMNSNYQKSIPLLIKDILKIEIDENTFGKKLNAYGIEFEAVMIYGISVPKGCDYNKKKLKYTLDDGTGEINIKYCVSKSRTYVKDKILGLREELNMEMKNKNSQRYAPNTYQSLNNLLKKAEQNISDPENHYRAGSRLYVVGIPYKIYGVTWIHANQIDLDEDQSRSREILYKEHLVRFYEKYSKNLRLDGTKIDS